MVDDAQWLDRASAQSLGSWHGDCWRSRWCSCSRRGAGRASSEDCRSSGRGLRDADARELLGSVIPGLLDERVRGPDRGGDGGNPLALLELPRGSRQLSCGRVRVAGRPVVVGSDRGELPAAARGLSEETRRLLFVAAAEPVGDPALFGGGRSGSGSRLRRWRPPSRRVAGGWCSRAVSASIGPLGGVPLGVAAERRAAHQALADATDRGARSRSSRMASVRRRQRAR